MTSSIFHYAFTVKDIESTIVFYHTILGCSIGRSTASWVDFDFFGHQASAHLSDNIPPLDYCGSVDGVQVPIPHFGCIVSRDEFTRIKQQLETHNIPFIIPPQIRYKGKKGEQLTMFLLDPSNNPIEFKSFTNQHEIFS